MEQTGAELAPRAERLLPRAGQDIEVIVGLGAPRWLGHVVNVSRSGLCARAIANDNIDLTSGSSLDGIALRLGHLQIPCGRGSIVRLDDESDDVRAIAIAFDREHPEVVDMLGPALRPQPYVIGELVEQQATTQATLDASDYTLDMFYAKPDKDLLAKCAAFRPWVEDMQRKQLFQRMWRVTATGPLDHRMTVFDPIQRTERTLICFDSNSYLGLHLHPKVIERTKEVLEKVGFGTASAQMLSGTNRYLRELEDDLSEHLGRESTIVYPTGFAANIGTIGALVRQNDAVVRDRFAHASVHEGCRSSTARFNKVFAHNNMRSLERMLQHADKAGCDGKLIVTDGVFSMHGRIAPLPDLVAMAKRYDARLMIDDAHGIGVLGDHGRGIEEVFDMPGSVDVLMGTLSKALGSLGGYVSGSRELIDYLRFYAPAGMFTTSLPAAVCAGLREALRLVRDEPEHRLRLWENIRRFSPALREAGFIVPDAVSPITTVLLGQHTLMMEVSRELFDAGIKCGNVMYPVVAKGDAILRMTVNARHTTEDIERTVDVLTRIGRKWGLLHRTHEELREIGRNVRLGPGAQVQRNVYTQSGEPWARHAV